jgi:ssDNA-binding Zn-finger/Zn-ribbon topoisomerase 1
MNYFDKTKNEDFDEIKYVEETNKCPKCGSERISICKGVEISVEENMSTGKILRKSKYGTTTFWVFKCRKCNWTSEACSE